MNKTANLFKLFQCWLSIPALKKVLFFSGLSLVLPIALPCNAWEVTTHQSMGRKSRDMFQALASLHPEWALCADQLTDYWLEVDNMLVHEDDSPNPLEHFFSPYTMEGLPTQRSAVVRAEEFWAIATSLYRAGDYPGAFRNLGRVCHLVQDTGCPAHTLLDPHPDFAPFEDFDSLHFYARDHEVHPLSNLLLAGDSLRAVMINLAFASAEWDSDDRCGHGPIGRGQGSINGLAFLGCAIGMDGFIITSDLQRIVEDCMPLTDMAVARVFMLFFEAVKPGPPLVVQPIQGVIYSGNLGVPLHAQVTVGGAAQRIRFEYQDRASQQPNQWVLIQSLPVPATGSVQSRWHNLISSAQVTIRMTALDSDACESLPALVDVKIDSTPPKIENKRP